MKRAEVLEQLRRTLACVPPEFVDDGCSSAPDDLFGADLQPACRVHDWRYCTRAHGPGELDQDYRRQADAELARNTRALLPLGLGWIGWLYWRAVHDFGGDAAYDSCGWSAGERCRHGLEPPAWMQIEAHGWRLRP